MPPASPWDLYDALLGELPADPCVARGLVGRAWTLIEAGGMGMAMTHRDEVQPATQRLPLAGRPLREVAAAVKSWNVREAAIGLAALNAWVNDRRRLEEQTGRTFTASRSEPIFAAMRDEIAGRRVAVIGHFPGIEALREHCQLTVLERAPQPGDLPDFAAEYVLPGQDYVFITGTTLVNKTLPRLLSLTAGAQVVLVGPSVPLTPRWFGWGVSVLAGTVVVDPERLWQAAAEGSLMEIWSEGAATVELRPADFGGVR
jgi:uncharacterized protein